MATYRLYRTARVGSGTADDPFRSRLADLLTSNGTGRDFWDWVHDGRPVRYCLALCPDALHTVLAADPQVTPMSPQFADRQELADWLDGSLSATPQAALDRLEADGFDLQWATPATTRRQAFRRLARLHAACQEFRRQGDTVGLALFGLPLTDTVGSLPANVKSRVLTWLQSRGADASGLDNSSTVRQVLKIALDGIDLPAPPLGPAAFS